MGLSRFLYLPAALLLAGMALSPALPAQMLAQAPIPALLNPSLSASSPPAPAPPAASSSAGAHPTPARLTPETLGDIAAAHHHYRAAISDYAGAPQMTAVLWDKTGIAYEMLHDFADALRSYQQALRLNPNLAQAYNNLGTLYGLARNFGKADRMYRTALRLDPDSPRFLMNFGTNLMAQHKFAEGWDAYQRALAIDPAVFNDAAGPTVGNGASLHNRGAMYYYIALGCARTGDAHCAVENLRAAIDRGFATAKAIASDNHFTALHRSASFQQLLDEESSR